MDLSDAPELVPVFTGTMDKLPSCIAVTPYLQLTPIKNWSLENFLRRTSLGIDVFLKALGLISSHKKLDEHVQCLTLKLFDSLIFLMYHTMFMLLL
jgi:hypothetical protein